MKKAPKKIVKKMGRPGKDKIIIAGMEADVKELIIRLARVGHTDKEIAELLALGKRTVENWKRRYPDFWHTLKRAKILADTEVETCLYKRATGMTVTETHTKEVVVKVGDKELPATETMTVKKELPPDVLAINTWLNNRKGEDNNATEIKWRQKQSVSVEGTIKQKIIRLVYPKEKEK